MKQGRHENLVNLGLDNNPRSGQLGSGPFTVLHYAKVTNHTTGLWVVSCGCCMLSEARF